MNLNHSEIAAILGHYSMQLPSLTDLLFISVCRAVLVQNAQILYKTPLPSTVFSEHLSCC